MKKRNKFYLLIIYILLLIFLITDFKVEEIYVINTPKNSNSKIARWYFDARVKF